MLSRCMLVSTRTFTFVAFEPRTISGSPPSDKQVGVVFPAQLQLPNYLRLFVPGSYRMNATYTSQ